VSLVPLRASLWLAPSRLRSLLSAFASLLFGHFRRTRFTTLQSALPPKGHSSGVFLLGVRLWLRHALSIRSVAVGGVLPILGARGLLLGWRSLAGRLIDNRAGELVEVFSGLLFA